jgi:putative ABC transport system ATP-binding protein
MVTHDIRSALRGNRVLYFRDGGVVGECLLGEYQSEDTERQAKLKDFLVEMGW